jgi:hypothetical protein
VKIYFVLTTFPIPDGDPWIPCTSTAFRIWTRWSEDGLSLAVTLLVEGGAAREVLAKAVGAAAVETRDIDWA